MRNPVQIFSAAMGTAVVAALLFGLGWAAGHSSRPVAVPPELYRSTTAALEVEFDGVAADLRNALLQRDLLARTSQTGAVLQKLGPESAEAVLEVFETVWLDVGQTELVLLANWWARADPHAALAWAESDLRTAATNVPFAVLRSWARQDPRAAIARASKGRRGNPKKRQAYMAAAIQGWEDSDQPGVMDFIHGLGVGVERQQMIRGFTRRKVLREGIDSTFRWADALSDEDKLFKLNVIRRVTTDAARIDPETTSKWVKKYDGSYYMRSLPQRVSVHWAKQDPPATMTWLEGLEPGRDRDEGVREGFRSWARMDYEAAVEWLTAGTYQGWKDEAMALYARRLQLADSETGAEMASQIVNKPLRVATQLIIARTWSVEDEQAATKWLEGRDDLTEKDKERALTYSESWRAQTVSAMEKRAKLDERSAQQRLEDWSDPEAEENQVEAETTETAG